MDVIILYEHKVREMETILFLKNELLKRGYKVEIFNVYQLNLYKFFLKKPKLIVTPFLYSDNELEKYVYSYFGYVKRIFNLQWEQVFTGKDTDDRKSNPSGFAQYAVHLCWGEKSYERLLKCGCKNALLLGPPQMDSLNSSLHFLYKPKEELFKEYSIPTDGSKLLFISSFSIMGYNEMDLEKLKALVDYDPYEFKKLTVDSRDEILGWFDKFLCQDEKSIVIYRPHPGEAKDEKIDRLIEKHKNFFYIRDYSIKQWILVCDKIMNWNSTAGMEAYFANKPIVFLRPFAFPVSLEYEIFKNPKLICNYDEFVEYSKLKMEEDKEDNSFENAIKLYYQKKSVPVFLDVCNEIEKMLKSEKYNMPRYSFHPFKAYIKRIKLFLQHIVFKLAESSRVMHVFLHNLGCFKNFLDYQDNVSKEIITKKEESDFLNKIKNL